MPPAEPPPPPPPKPPLPPFVDIGELPARVVVFVIYKLLLFAVLLDPLNPPPPPAQYVVGNRSFIPFRVDIIPSPPFPQYSFSGRTELFVFPPYPPINPAPPPPDEPPQPD
jgi:hypothetical protein